MIRIVPGVAVVSSLALAVLAVAAPAKSRLVANAASVCDSCAEWNADREPFRVFGNTYYVGVAGLSSSSSRRRTVTC
jgi:metallo-beta-lactamase class B